MTAAGRPSAAIGLRALRGGSVVVGVTLDAGEPGLLLSKFVATADAGDRLAEAPYHVAYEMTRDPDGGASPAAAAAVAEGRRRQDALAADGLADIVATLRQAGYEPAVAALLINRAGWMTDLLSYSLAFPEHPLVAEGLAVREALRFAAGHCRLPVEELDEKSLFERAPKALTLRSDELDGRLQHLGKVAGRPWRKEQKLACLAAWVALADCC